jgi:uncharacterized protein (TIRG00374 family)
VSAVPVADVHGVADTSRRGGPTRRAVVLGLVLGFPASALFLYLAARNLNWDAVLDALARADPVRAAAGVAALCSVYVVQAVRWRWIAREARLPVQRFVELVVAAIACNNAVPGRPGDLLRAHWLGRAARMSRSRALGTVVVDRASDVLALVIFLAVSYTAVGHHAGWMRRLDVAALVVAAAVVLVLLGARFHERRAGSSFARRLPVRVVSDVLGGIGQTVNRRDAAVVGALSLAAWAAWASGAWLIASSLGIGLSPLEAVFVTAIVNLGVAIPSSPGFVGTYQWLCVAALGALAVGRADAFAFSVLLHAAWFVPTSVAGLLLLVTKSSARLAVQIRTRAEARGVA